MKSLLPVEESHCTTVRVVVVAVEGLKPAQAAAWISSKTSCGCETGEAWLDVGIVSAIAFIPLANICWSVGGIMRLSLEIRNYDGIVFHEKKLEVATPA